MVISAPVRQAEDSGFAEGGATLILALPAKVRTDMSSEAA